MREKRRQDEREDERHDEREEKTRRERREDKTRETRSGNSFDNSALELSFSKNNKLIWATIQPDAQGTLARLAFFTYWS